MDPISFIRKNYISDRYIIFLFDICFKFFNGRIGLMLYVVSDILEPDLNSLLVLTTYAAHYFSISDFIMESLFFNIIFT